MRTVLTVYSRLTQGPWCWAIRLWHVGHSWDSWIFTRPLSCCKLLLQLETNCSICWTLEAYSFTSVVLPHSIDPLLGSIVDVSHQTLPVGRPFHVVIALYFILLCCLCHSDANRAASSSCCLARCCWITILLLAKMYFTRLLEPRSRSSSLTPVFQINAVAVCILHQFQTHSWFHVG